ncbi:flagellar protein FlgN [Echinimonas agarilytica]|uniref:Flagellar protein FlgN n=1 Tax=Echinimonas agarilytica TaxID=1215918 RepID=A0AA41W4W2_9GAMM|nr:flagellar protein FlgN [Echinimonas agarilytica]MCM2678930.1 flagellar protein FlgN [Echinimonas agarilytica]
MSNSETALDLLGQQLQRLNQLQELLLVEQKILSERKLDDLSAIPPKKNDILRQLQAGDQALAAFDLKAQQFQRHLAKAKAMLQLCKQLNEDNGKSIALAMTSIGRIHGVMSKIGQQGASTTYTAQGGKSQIGSSGNVVSV